MSEDQLQPDDTLDDRGVDDVLDEGYSPPEREPGFMKHLDDHEETLDERSTEEEPEVWEEAEQELDAEIVDGDVGGEVGEERTGRLVADDGTAREQDVAADDEGIDGGAASAEEAAVHTVGDDQGLTEELDPEVLAQLDELEQLDD